MSEPKYINIYDAINCIDDITDGIDAAEFTAKWIKGFLLSFPAAPVALTSRWVWTDDGNRCKRCLKLGDPIPTPYCPNCGAKMQEDVQP